MSVGSCFFIGFEGFCDYFVFFIIYLSLSLYIGDISNYLFNYMIELKLGMFLFDFGSFYLNKDL